MIDQTVYADSTDSDSGALVAGYASETDQLHGDQGLADLQAAVTNGTRVPMGSTTYEVASRADDAATAIYLVASQTQYADVGYGKPQESDISYLAWNHLLPTEVRGAPPLVSSAQHGSGTSTPILTWFDPYGRVQFTQSSLGYIDYTAYDNATGAVTYSVVDADPDHLPDEFAPTAGPTRSNQLAPALALTTIASPDALGRPTQIIDPSGNVTLYNYVDTQSLSEVDVLPPAGPMQATIDNYALGFEDVATFSGWAPPGNPTVLSWAGRILLSLTRTVFDNAGRPLLVEPYFNVQGLTYDPTTWDASTRFHSGARRRSGGDAIPHSEFWQHGNFYVTSYNYDFSGSSR